MPYEGRDYTVVECRDCDVLQTVEHYSEVSPKYVDLMDEEIDHHRLWCQGDQKLPAFRQWEAQTRRFQMHLNRPPRLLDIVCGTGGFLRYARLLGMAVFGFDASKAQAEFARRDVPDVRWAYTPGEYLDFLGERDLRFDIVTKWDVLEHVRTPLDFLPSIRSIMRPGGFLFVSVPNGKAMLWKRKMRSILGQRQDLYWVPWEHVFYYSIWSLTAYIRNAGFRIHDCGAVACYPRSLSVFEAIRRFGFFCLRAVPSLARQIYVWAQAPLLIAPTGESSLTPAE